MRTVNISVFIFSILLCACSNDNISLASPKRPKFLFGQSSEWTRGRVIDKEGNSHTLHQAPDGALWSDTIGAFSNSYTSDPYVDQTANLSGDEIIHSPAMDACREFGDKVGITMKLPTVGEYMDHMLRFFPSFQDDGRPIKSSSFYHMMGELEAEAYHREFPFVPVEGYNGKMFWTAGPFSYCRSVTGSVTYHAVYFFDEGTYASPAHPYFYNGGTIVGDGLPGVNGVRCVSFSP